MCERACECVGRYYIVPFTDRGRLRMTPSQYDPRYQDLLPQDPKFKMCKVMTDKVMCFAAGKNFSYHHYVLGSYYYIR